MTIIRKLVEVKTFVPDSEEYGVSFGIEIKGGHARAWIQQSPEEHRMYSASYEVDRDPEIISEEGSPINWESIRKDRENAQA